jgi:hypothetical protein
MSQNPYAAPKAELGPPTSMVSAYYVPVLCVTVSLFLLLNVMALLHGKWTTLVAIAFQVLVLGSVLTKKSWAYVAVRWWAAFLILSGSLLWLAALFSGKITESTYTVVLRSLCFIFGIYFFKYAKSALAPEMPSVAPDSQPL